VNIALIVFGFSLDILAGYFGAKLHKPSYVYSPAEVRLIVQDAVDASGTGVVVFVRVDHLEKMDAQTTFNPVGGGYDTVIDPRVLTYANDALRHVAAHEACHMALHAEVLQGKIRPSAHVETDAEKCADKLVKHMAKRRK
jgi:hypothetical protein